MAPLSFNARTLKGINIPNSLTNLGGSAFLGCSNLTSLDFSGSRLSAIGGSTLYQCGLQSVVFPPSINQLGVNALAECPNLIGVYFAGNAPSFFSSGMFDGDNSHLVVYHLPGAFGWGPTFAGVPTAQAGIAAFGLGTNGFGFATTWPSGTTVVVEGTTNLTNPSWVPLPSSMFPSGSFNFRDPHWTNYPGRFYRLRWQVLIPPVITSQPTNQVVVVPGTAATFNVSATGTGPLAYQWNFNGTPISGQTNASLTLMDVQPAQAGTYTVLVTNSFGSAVSSNAVLTVNPPLPCVTPPVGLVGWWQGEGNANDATGLNNGVLNGVGFAPGLVGQAFSFNGYQSFVSVAGSPSLSFTNAMTFEAWIYPHSFSDYNIVSTFWNPGFGPLEFHVGHDGRFACDLRDATHTGDVPAVSAFSLNPIPAGTWSHVAVVYDGTALGVYVDGVINTSVPWNGGISPAGGALYIGSTPLMSHLYDGLIDEVSLYNRALSASEIQAIYLAGSAGKCH